MEDAAADLVTSKKAGCVFRGHRAVSVMDEEGHFFPRGRQIEVCTDTLAKLSHAPYKGAFALIEPDGDVPEVDPAGCADGACAPGCC